MFKNEIYHEYSEFELSVNSINQYIVENNIRKPIQLKTQNPSLYDAICRRLTKYEKSKIIYPDKTMDCSLYRDFDSIQQFIIKNNIINKKDLHNRFPGVYLNYLNLRDTWTKELKFIDSKFKYLGECLIAKELIKRGVVFITQKTFQDLKMNLSLRFDFYLPDYNILIEHQGEAHFGKGRYYNDKLIKSDKLKFEYAKKNKIKLLYFTIYKSDYNKLGYFDKVITDIDQLMLEIDSNLNILDNYEELINNYFK